MNSFKPMLFLHWKAARWPLAPFVLLAFSLPMFMMRLMQVTRPSGFDMQITAADIIQAEQSMLLMFPLLAIVVGATIALTAWSWDHQSRHVYALSLPISRARFSLLKLSAGAVLIAAPVLALFLGTMIGLALTPLPPELHAYPFAFTLRFLLAVLIAYAATFALAATTVRTTTIFIIAIVLVLILGTIAVDFLQNALHDYTLVTPAELVVDALMNWPGPFSVFGGSWMLIDA